MQTRQDTPFGAGASLGRWAGVPIRAHWSVGVAFGLFTWVLATVYLPTSRPGQPAAAYWLTGAGTALAFLGTVLVHELAHALMARRYRMPVQRITLWMVGGLTELGGEPPTARADAVIAASGPVVSMVLGAGFAVLAAGSDGHGLLGAGLTWIAAVNMLLGVFNLLPGAPLDGGRLLRALLWWRSGDRSRAAARAAGAGRALGMGLIVIGLIALLLGAYTGAWVGVLGWFVLSGAASERYAIRAETLHGLVVADIMTSTPVVAASWFTVARFLSSVGPQHLAQPVFPVVDLEGQPTGTITLSAVERVPAASRDTTRLSDLTRDGPAWRLTSLETDLAELWLSLHLRGGVAIVVDDGRPIGVVTMSELKRAARFVGLRGTRRDAAPQPDSR